MPEETPRSPGRYRPNHLSTTRSKSSYPLSWPCARRLRPGPVGIPSAFYHPSHRVGGGNTTRPDIGIADDIVTKLFLGYTRKIAGATWDARFKVKNIENDQILLGGYANSRYTASQLWALSTTVKI